LVFGTAKVPHIKRAKGIKTLIKGGLTKEVYFERELIRDSKIHRVAFVNKLKKV
jgi:hypothetical protein